MSISPKLANSTPDIERSALWSARHELLRHRPDVIRKLIASFRYQFKFVIDSPADMDEVARYLHEFPEIQSQDVWLMPQGVEPGELEEKAKWLAPYCEEHGFRFCPRKQIEWYGMVRGR